MLKILYRIYLSVNNVSVFVPESQYSKVRAVYSRLLYAYSNLIPSSLCIFIQILYIDWFVVVFSSRLCIM